MRGHKTDYQRGRKPKGHPGRGKECLVTNEYADRVALGHGEGQRRKLLSSAPKLQRPTAHAHRGKMIGSGIVNVGQVVLIPTREAGSGLIRAVKAHRGDCDHFIARGKWFYSYGDTWCLACAKAKGLIGEAD